MLTTKQFDEFRKEIECALQDIANKYGVDINAGKIKYEANSFTLELKVNKQEINGKSFEQVEFEKNCHFYGLKPEDYNHKFIFKGESYSLIGFKIRATKMPILAISSKGTTYKFGEDTVKRLLDKPIQVPTEFSIYD